MIGVNKRIIAVNMGFINVHHYTGITLLSVNPQHNGQKFTDKSLVNGGLSVKCVLLTDKPSKKDSLSVKLE